MPILNTSTPKKDQASSGFSELSTIGMDQSSDNFGEGSNWRKSHPTYNSKIRHLFENNVLPHDVTFIVGQDEDSTEKVGAHKFVLSLQSPVFQKLFETDVHQTPLIPYADSTTFKAFLQFIYTDDVTLDGFNTPMIISLVKLVKEYQILSLLPICCEELKRKIGLNSALSILQTAYEIDDIQLHEMAQEYICRNGIEILSSESFLDASYRSVNFILQNDHLLASEVEIFNAAFRWAHKKCFIEGLNPPDPNTIRLFLGNIVRAIRYPLMTPDEFVLHVVPRGILTVEEKVEILQFMAVTDTLKRSLGLSTFSSKPRVPKCQQSNSIYIEGLLHQLLTENPSQVCLQNCTVDLNRFLGDLASLKLPSRKQIETLSLSNVKLVNIQDPIEHCVRLVNLEHFHLSINSSNFRFDSILHQETLVMVCEHFQTYLFFCKKSKVDCPFSDLWDTKVNIELWVDGNILLVMNHEKQSVVLNKLSNTNLMLKSLNNSEDVVNLAISLRPLKPLESCSVFQAVESVSFLTVHNAHRLKNQFDLFIRGFPNVSELVLQGCNLQLNLGKIIIGLRKLQKLSLSDAIFSGRYSDLQEGVEFTKIEILSLWNCSWDNNFEERFAQIFPKLREIHIYNNFVDKSLCHFLRVCFQLKNVERIVISGYIWGNSEQNDSYLFVKEFFDEMGIRGNQYNICVMKNRNIVSNEEDWIGFELTNDQVSKNLYQQFHYDRFYLDVNAFLKKFKV